MHDVHASPCSLVQSARVTCWRRLSLSMVASSSHGGRLILAASCTCTWSCCQHLAPALNKQRWSSSRSCNWVTRPQCTVTQCLSCCCAVAAPFTPACRCQDPAAACHPGVHLRPGGAAAAPADASAPHLQRAGGHGRPGSCSDGPGREWGPGWTQADPAAGSCYGGGCCRWVVGSWAEVGGQLGTHVFLVYGAAAALMGSGSVQGQGQGRTDAS